MTRLGDEFPSWAVALAAGLASASTFPIGAMLGALGTAPALKKASDEEVDVEDSFSWSAGFMAFGAGCLLFAVTVELYGEAVEEMELHGYFNEIPWISTTVVCAMLGAWGYIEANRWVGKVLQEGGPRGADEETPLMGDCVWRTRSSQDLRARMQKSLMVGFASWFGVLVSGIPEGVLLGQLVNNGHLSLVLVVSLLVSNFPTAYASACMLKHGGKGNLEIVFLWSAVFLVTGFLAAALPLFMSAGTDDSGVPSSFEMYFGHAMEGFAGGSMLACILAVMLPEAYHVQGDSAGLIATAGFLAAVVIKVFGGLVTDFEVNADDVPDWLKAMSVNSTTSAGSNQTVPGQ